MKLLTKNSDIFVPDNVSIEQALPRTTHLCVAAHPDDIEIFAYHGISECFGKSDKWFTGVIVTNGAGSPRSGIYKDYTDEQMQQVRRMEQKKAAVIGEYSVCIQLGYPSSVLKDSENKDVVEDLKTIFLNTKPGFVYLHNPADKHDTHICVFLRCIEALRSISDSFVPEKIFSCEVWRNLDWVQDEDKIVLPVSDYPGVSSALLGVFDSQISGGKRYDLATMGRRLANATYYSPHQIDEYQLLTYAIDVRPLVVNKNLSVELFIEEIMLKFVNDVKTKIRKFI
jgi:LmbE family N-acetylglucosaminyl deacetylase